MADGSKIEWTDASWNPLRGCSRVSAGCERCYAEAVARRFVGPGLAYEGLTNRHGAWSGEIMLLPDKLDEPLRWRRPRRVFVNSMSDMFHENVPDSYIDRVFAVMGVAMSHTFQVLTKRPQRMLEYLTGQSPLPDRDLPIERIRDAALMSGYTSTPEHIRWPLPNVHLGVSVEDQATADERVPLLLQTPAAVRFVSYEPALGPVDFDSPALHHQYLPGHLLDWIIVGGESGPGARPCDVEWIRSAVRQCRAAAVPVFVKQLGACAYDAKNGIAGRALKVDPDAEALISRRLRDRKGGDMSEWPPDLRVREFPA